MAKVQKLAACRLCSIELRYFIRQLASMAMPETVSSKENSGDVVFKEGNVALIGNNPMLDHLRDAVLQIGCRQRAKENGSMRTSFG